MLEEQSHERIQMRDIAETSGVALGTVYRYFGSKEHLLAAALAVWSASLGEWEERHVREVEASPMERLSDTMSRVLDAFERWPQFFDVLALLETTPDEFARAVYTDYGHDTTATFRRSLAELPAADAGDVLNVVLAVLSHVLRGWRRGSFDMDEARAQMRRAIELVFQGVPATASP